MYLLTPDKYGKAWMLAARPTAPDRASGQRAVLETGSGVALGRAKSGAPNISDA